MKTKETYIYAGECPIENSIKFVAHGKINKAPLYIRKTSNYKKWLSYLKSKNEKIKFIVLDKVLYEEADFWIEHYRFLFKSWGFELLEQNNFDKRDLYLTHHLEKLETLISEDITDFRHQVYNINTFIYFVSDLLTITFSSRKIDDFCLLVVLIFFYGRSITEISQLDYKQLEIAYVHKDIFGQNTYPRIRRFIQRYILNYQNKEQRICSSILNNGQYSANLFQKQLKNIMKNFGYDDVFPYSDKKAICTMLFLSIKGNFSNNRNIINNIFGYDDKYIKYYLLNSSISQFIIPQQPDIFNSHVS